MYSLNFDNLNQFSFTPRDYQTELLAAAIERNIIVCLSQNTAKEFVFLAYKNSLEQPKAAIAPAPVVPNPTKKP